MQDSAENYQTPAAGAVAQLMQQIIPAIPSSRHNMVPLLRDIFESAIDALDREPDDWTEIDAMQILQLDIQLRDALRTDDFAPSIPIPEALAAALLELQGTLRDLGFDGERNEHEVEVDGELLERVRSAKDLVTRLRSGTDWARDPARVLKCLGQTLEIVELNQRMRLDVVSKQHRIAESTVGESFHTPGREISRAVGIALTRWPEQAFPGAILVDSDAAWAPEMIVLPACRDGFLMGSPKHEPDCSEDELQRTVRITQMIALARFPIMFTEYEAYCSEAGVEVPDDRGWGRERRPVINVSWHDADTWCRWISERLERTYRLPSEAEWEFACRGDPAGRNQTPFCPDVARAGNGEFITPEEANFEGEFTYNGSDTGEDRQKTVPVDHPGFRPNRFGLWQMHGNVDEWIKDVYEADPGLRPVDGSAHLPQPIPEDHSRVLRGGSWNYDPRSLRSAFRDGVEPVGRSDGIGFRPARMLLTA